MEKEFKEFKVVNEIRAVHRDGVWYASELMTHSRRKDSDSEWEQKEVYMEASDKDFNVALANTIFSIQTYLKSIGGDLFSVEEEPEELLN